jgi:hypothetical protein
MSKGTQQQELERQAQKSFSKDERARESQRRFVDEEEPRHASNTAKTGRLREQRLARDAAAEADAAKVAAESKPLSEPPKKKLRRPRASSSQTAASRG